MRTLYLLLLLTCMSLAPSCFAQKSTGLFSNLTNNVNGAAQSQTASTISGTLTIAGKAYNVVKYSFGLYRNVDGQGRPSSAPSGGQLRLTIQADSTTSLWEMSNDQYRKVSGTLTMKQDGTGRTVRKVDLEDAYVVEYSEYFDAALEHPLVLEVVFSARKLRLGEATFQNEWPK